MSHFFFETRLFRFRSCGEPLFQHLFFFLGGDFVNQIWSQKILYPKKTWKLFTLEPTQLAQECATRCVTSSTVNGDPGDPRWWWVGKNRERRHEVPKVVNDPNDLMQWISSFSKKTQMEVRFFQCCQRLCGSYFMGIQLWEFQIQKVIFDSC